MSHGADHGAVARGRALALLAAATLSVTYSQSILESIIAIWALHKYGFGRAPSDFCCSASPCRRC